MDQKPELSRSLGLLEVSLSGLGIILGAGIYALLGEAAALAGNAVWISFVLAALVALLTGLSYAELSSMFPKASAEYEYTSQAFGRQAAFIVGWLIILSGVISSATVALGFAGYFEALFQAPRLPSALALTVLLSIVLFLGIKQSAWVAIVFTMIETLGLLIVIALGIPYLGSVNYLEMPHGLEGIFQAAALIFFAYLGFEEMVKLSEETVNPEVNLPRGLIIAVLASIVLYVAVSLSAVSVLGWRMLGQSSAPFADIASAAFGPQAFFLLSLIALFATTNTVLLMLLAASRIIYGMAASSALPAFLAEVHPATRTPRKAVLAAMIPTMAFIMLEDIGFVANVANFTIFVTFMVINATLIMLRYRQPSFVRPFRVPLSIGRMPLIPILALFFNLFMLTQLSLEVMLLGAALLVIGGTLSLAAASSNR
jgi:APA family basic amino acid/polyamine antiporter